MKCGLCGRTLKNSDSRKMGYGSICYKRIFGNGSRPRRRAQREPPSESAVYYEIPGQISIEDYLRESGNL